MYLVVASAASLPVRFRGTFDGIVPLVPVWDTASATPEAMTSNATAITVVLRIFLRIL
jgi:hypothetical protein